MISRSSRSVLQTVRNLSVSSQQLSSAAPALLQEKIGTARIVTLNRPKALNALNLDMVRELYPLLQKWNCSDDVNMVIVKGAGGKAFCAGGDVLAVIKSAKAQDAGEDSKIHEDFFREEYQLNHLIGTLSKPYIALIDGIVMGGGCGLSVNGRFRVATEKTLLAMPETALGLFPDVGGSYFLSRLRDNLGMYIALTGYKLNGADAFHAGLASHFVHSSDLGTLEGKLTGLNEVSEQSINSTIRSLAPREIPPFSLENELPRIRDTFQGRSIEDIISNLENDGSEWANKQIKTLSKMSPTSLKVTFRQLQSGKRMSFAKIFNMEYRLTQRFVHDFDFHEGCRAILIDKDRNPKWRPSRLEEVDDAVIDKYFSPLSGVKEFVVHEDE